jgi:hypothetical protein
MLNPGYRIIAKKERFNCKPGQAFVCPECKTTFLEVDATDKFLTKCPKCRRWLYGEKIVDKTINQR